jgi:hypothetical protein
MERHGDPGTAIVSQRTAQERQDGRRRMPFASIAYANKVNRNRSHQDQKEQDQRLETKKAG